MIYHFLVGDSSDVFKSQMLKKKEEREVLHINKKQNIHWFLETDILEFWNFSHWI